MSDLEQRVAGLSPAKRELLRQLAARQRMEQGRIARRARPERIPLTFGQRRLWLVDRMSPGGAAYNVPVALWLDGPLDVQALKNAVQSLADRHEPLRTVFEAHDGEPFQRIRDHAEVPWRVLLAAGDDAPARRAHTMTLASADLARGFDLARDTMLRATLIEAAEHSHLLLLCFHHIAVDGWSTSLLVHELQDAYAQLRTGVAPTAGEPALQVADYALWQHDTLSGEGLDKQLEHWRSHLEGAPAALDLPADRSRPPIQSFEGATVRIDLPVALMPGVEAFARARGATASMVFLAAYQLLLARYTMQHDVVVGMGVAGRARAELEPVVGFFVNTLPMRSRIDGAAGFDVLLEQARQHSLAAMENADAPLDRVLEALRVPRSSGFTPFAQAMFFFQNYPPADPSFEGLTARGVQPGELGVATAQADITLFVEATRDGRWQVALQYASDLFDRARVERMAGHLVTLLESALAAPAEPVSRLALLNAAEQASLHEWNDTSRELPADPSLAGLVEAQVARSPEAIALRFDGREMRYAELDARANLLANELRARGVDAGVLVGLYVDRTPEMLVGLLGILKAGGAYVPMDPTYPADRLTYMLEVAQADVLVTTATLAASMSFDVPHVVTVDASSALPDKPVMAPAREVRADDPAYVIFTSGSTGRPKGVEVRQLGAVNLLRSVACAPGLQAGEVLCAISTLSFDIALFELVLPLTVGATVLLLDRETARDGVALRRRIESENFQVMQATPATWRMLLEVGWTGRRGLRIVSTGEALPRELAQRLLPCADELWNLYGPTETTVYSALCRVEAGEGAILVGRPVDNTQIHIVDANMQRLPVGVPGELLIGGEGLANGYRGRPDLTAEKFIPDPFGAPGTRLYRTGDLAFWRDDGTIEVIGRIDHQIKLRGFRIELGEIESVLCQHPDVTQAVVHCREDRPGDKRLVAYVTAGDASPCVGALRDRLKAALPEYMVPSAFVVLERFPLTPNGKVDRNALPAPETLQSAGTDEAPRTPEEEALLSLWQQLLGTPRVGLRDNFFELGGHSLLATRLLARIAQTFAVELPLRALFESPTLEQLAARVASEREALPMDDLEALLQSLEHLSDEEASRLAESGEHP